MTDPRIRMPLAAAQAVLNPLSDAAIFLVATITPGSERAVRDALPELQAIQTELAAIAPRSLLTCITSIGSDAWSRLFSGPRPARLHVLPEYRGAVHASVTTPGDLLFHIRAQGMDLVFELATRLMARLDGLVTVVDEVHGFRYFDERDLLGFVDGTENPKGSLAVASVLVDDDGPQFLGGSYVVVQKYLHDLAAWNSLTVEQQQLVIGRTKESDVELTDEQKPSNAHIALTVIEDADGNERKIIRDNMPFGRPGAAEFGTYFIGYAKDPAVTEEMLRRMFIGEPEGNHDRILDFSTAVTGGLFFTPPTAFLVDPPPIPA